MTTRNAIIRTASSQIGYKERGNNITKYWAELYPKFQGAPWCAAFTAWVYKQNGSDILLTGPSAPYYTPSMEAWAKKTGRWRESKDCLPGDVLIFGTRGAVHTGLLLAQDGANVRTIEGNTSSPGGGSDTDGGGVYARRRSRSWVRGCISMSSEMTQTNSLGGGKTAPIPPKRPGLLVEDGELGPLTYAALERYLGQPANGDLDRMTVRALQTWVGNARTGRLTRDDIRDLQTKVGATRDGVWGPSTTLGLQRFLNRRIREKG